MSLHIKGQKFLGSDKELINFIQNDLQDFFSKQFDIFFNNKETAIKIGEAIKIHIKKEEHELNILNKILESKDIKLSEQQSLIIKNKTTQKAEQRISTLKSYSESKSYIELLKKLQSYYKQKEYSVVLDLNYLSLDSKILIFFYDGAYYTSLQADNETLFINYILENKQFTDYSFDFYDTDEKKVNSKELKEEIKKEETWKNIYSLITAEEKNKTQIATSFSFDIFKELNISNEKDKELLRLVKTNARSELNKYTRRYTNIHIGNKRARQRLTKAKGV